MIGLGHEVTILTGMPNYPTGRIFPEYRGKLLMTERYEGMRVVRTWMYPTTSVGFVKRTASQLSFAVTSALLGPLRLGQYDCALIGSPPLFLALSACILKRVVSCPYVMVVADLWPEVAIETGALRNPRAIKLAKWLEMVFYRNALAVVTQTPGQAANIRARYPRTRTHVVTGGVDVDMFSPDFRSDEIRREFGVDGKIAVVYFGLHGFAQGLDVILDAAARLTHRDDIRFLTIGSGAVKGELVERAAKLGLDNLKFHDPVPRARIPAIAASMDIGLVSLGKGVPKATMPTKIYEVMASGRPVIVAADGESQQLVRDEELGLAVAAGADEELAAAIEALADDADRRHRCAANGLRVARERFDRRASARRLHELLVELIGEGRR